MCSDAEEATVKLAPTVCRRRPGPRRGATPRDFRLLPRRIVLVRHAQSEGNVDNFQYTYVPDPKVPLVSRGPCVFRLGWRWKAGGRCT